MSRSAMGLATLLLVLGSSCAPRTATTTWPSSSWTGRSGGGARSWFKKTRSECLEQAGIADPERVEPKSAEETRFLRCMNDAGWCTYTFRCEKRGT